MDNGEGAIDRLRSVETEAVQATAQQLSQVRGEMARVEAALDGHRKATASALDVMRVELEKASARLATEEARSDASVRAALGQALSNTDNKVIDKTKPDRG